MQLFREKEIGKRRYRITISMRSEWWFSEAEWKTEVERWNARRKTWDDVAEWHDIVSSEEILAMRRELRDSILLV